MEPPEATPSSFERPEEAERKVEHAGQGSKKELSPEARRKELLADLHELGTSAERLHNTYFTAVNEATGTPADFAKLNKLDAVNDLRWVNGALAQIAKIPEGDTAIELAVPDATLTRLRGQLAKARALQEKRAESKVTVSPKQKQIATLQALADRIPPLMETYTKAVNQAKLPIAEFSQLDELDAKNDFRWANGAIEELNRIPSGDPEIDLVVPDQPLARLRSVISKAEKLKRSR